MNERDPIETQMFMISKGEAGENGGLGVLDCSILHSPGECEQNLQI
jgi:hypothetical protein